MNIGPYDGEHRIISDQVYKLFGIDEVEVSSRFNDAANGNGNLERNRSEPNEDEHSKEDDQGEEDDHHEKYYENLPSGDSIVTAFKTTDNTSAEDSIHDELLETPTTLNARKDREFAETEARMLARLGMKWDNEGMSPKPAAGRKIEVLTIEDRQACNLSPVTAEDFRNYRAPDFEVNDVNDPDQSDSELAGVEEWAHAEGIIEAFCEQKYQDIAVRVARAPHMPDLNHLRYGTPDSDEEINLTSTVPPYSDESTQELLQISKQPGRPGLCVVGATGGNVEVDPATFEDARFRQIHGELRGG